LEPGCRLRRREWSLLAGFLLWHDRRVADHRLTSLCRFERWTRLAEPEGRGSSVTARDSWICTIDPGAELQLFGPSLTKG
jgi:hypothetical protein